MKLITWKFADMRATTLEISKHVFIQRGKWDGLMFSVSGMGLSKSERNFFKIGFLEMHDIVNIYLGRVVISFDKRGVEEHLRSVKIIETQSVKKVLSEKFWSVVQGIRDGVSSKYHDYLNRHQFKQVYDFVLLKAYEGPFTFQSDMLSAFQLASNYEADLMYGAQFIHSPTGLEHEKNLALVEKYLGKRFITNDHGYNFRGYKREDSPEIKYFRLEG